MMGCMPPTAASGAPSAPVVGRAEELARLRSVLRGEDSTSAVLIGGDAGVGKSRLVGEFTEHAEKLGWQVLIGHCLDFGEQSVSYLPFTDVFGQLARRAGAWLQEVTAAHPALQRLLPGARALAGGAVPPAAAEDVGRTELFSAVRAALSSVGEPVVVVIEDLHWADRSTQNLLSFLFAQELSESVRFVVTYRSDDLHRRHPLRPRLAEWIRLPAVLRMPLEPLADVDVRTLVRAVGAEGLPERRVHAIVRRAQGNAFFAEELTAAGELSAAAVPDGLADLLLVRIDRLGEDARTVVRAASGLRCREVPHESLTHVLQLPVAQLEEALREAVEANVLIPAGGSAYAFRHALFAEAVYDDLLPGERSRLHSGYASAMAQGRIRGAAAELAGHALAARDLRTALSASITAGREAMSVGGAEEAIGHLELAIQLVTDPQLAADAEVDVIDLHIRAADALATGGYSQRAAELVQQQLGELPPHTPATGRAWLLVTLAEVSLYDDGGEPVALVATKEALDLLEPGPSELRAATLAVHARVHMLGRRFAEATQFARECLDIATTLGLTEVVVDASTTLGRVKDKVGNLAASITTLRQTVDHAREMGDVVGLIRSLHQLGLTTMEGGQVDQARALFGEVATLAASHGRPWAPYGFDARVLAALTNYQLGDWEAVDRLTDMSGQAPPALCEALLLAMRAQVAAGRGDPHAAAMVTQLRPWWTREGWCTILSVGPAIDIYGGLGDLDAAMQAYQDGVAGITALWGTPRFAAQTRWAALLIGQLASHTGRASGAERRRNVERGTALTEDAHLALDSTSDLRPAGAEALAWRSRVDAELLRLRHLAGEAVTRWELSSAWRRATEAFESLGHIFEEARSAQRWSAAVGSAERPAELTGYLHRAHQVAHHLGALPLLAELRQADPGPARRPAASLVRADTPALTARESQVLELVAAGRSNGQIAQQLFITTKTVSVHVSNILGKLGVASRTEAAAVARQRGLLP